jgi:hypothetical protein
MTGISLIAGAAKSKTGTYFQHYIDLCFFSVRVFFKANLGKIYANFFIRKAARFLRRMKSHVRYLFIGNRIVKQNDANSKICLENRLVVVAEYKAFK